MLKKNKPGGAGQELGVFSPFAGQSLPTSNSHSLSWLHNSPPPLFAQHNMLSEKINTFLCYIKRRGEEVRLATDQLLIIASKYLASVEICGCGRARKSLCLTTRPQRSIAHENIARENMCTTAHENQRFALCSLRHPCPPRYAGPQTFVAFSIPDTPQCTHAHCLLMPYIHAGTTFHRSLKY